MNAILPPVSAVFRAGQNLAGASWQGQNLADAASLVLNVSLLLGCHP